MENLIILGSSMVFGLGMLAMTIFQQFRRLWVYLAIIVMFLVPVFNEYTKETFVAWGALVMILGVVIMMIRGLRN